MSGVPLAVVLVTGLSGGGKASALRALEDLGFEAVDNPPLDLIETLALRAEGKLAIGVDCRTRGFDAEQIIGVVRRLKAHAGLRPELVYVEARDEILQRRFTETLVCLRAQSSRRILTTFFDMVREGLVA